ncbi:MAG: 1-acyl-sn-glycerol-3-phosphate acyltransferase [Zoogloeaceae bacterium]|jgi:1-acyl-sn-glycerol-3-phosphate acyltransferase|nr:1-acyl-sn-glycerol-3-phosphate acyltransferase [Zoogloeaceae bacterium]
MTFLRSILFMTLAVLLLPPFVVLLFLLCWLPKRPLRRFSMIMVVITAAMIKYVLRIDYRLIGAENIPAGPCVILSKHQSAWETIFLQYIFKWTAFVYKRELHWVPFLGWGLAIMPFVPIDRGAGKDALFQVAKRGTQRLREGYSIVIFPEGTRVAPGTQKRYKGGGAYLAKHAGVPVAPVALNSGEFWPRQAFIKHPGTVTVSIGPPIDPAELSAEDINRRAEEWIETEMRRISPHLYGNPSETPPPACTGV